jgi:hypothetical protein
MAKRKTAKKRTKKRTRGAMVPRTSLQFATKTIARLSQEKELLQARLDMANERQLEAEQKLFEAEQRKEEPKSTYRWTTADGRRLAPREMDEQHLRNTICWLQRTLVARFGTAKYLQELAPRVEALHEMLKEAEERNIDV